MATLKPLHTLLRDLCADTGGATIVEFAFVLLPLMTLLMGGFDLGYQAYLQSVVQGALNDVARSASMEAPNIECADAALVDRVKCAVKRRSDLVARSATYDVQIKNYFDFANVGRSEKLVTDYNGNGQYNTGDCYIDLNSNGRFDLVGGRDGVGGADDVAFYEVTVRMPRLFPIHRLMSVPEQYVIIGKTAIRNQPYAKQKTPPTVCN